MYYNKVEICGTDTSTLKTLTEKEKTEGRKMIDIGDGSIHHEICPEYTNQKMISEKKMMNFRWSAF